MSRRIQRARKRSGVRRFFLWGGFLLLLGCIGTFAYFHARFSRMIESRMAGEVFQNSSTIFSAPRRISVGDRMSPGELVHYLQRAGYSARRDSEAPGQVVAEGSAVEIRPSRRSYFASGNSIRLEFAGGRISRIRPLETGQAKSWAELEPEVLSNLFDDRSREKRRLVRYSDLPRILVDAVLSAEDRRFFDHPGLDFVRVLGAAWSDLRQGAKAEGASTITMQVARSFFFSTRREWSRKLSETMVALELERRFTKEQIFELYANQIYLGNRGSFAIHGFGEAALAYFGKDVRRLSLGEVAFLAGIIRSPNRYAAAERKPERAAEARDRILTRMVGNGVLSTEEAERSRKMPLRFVRSATESNPSAYFVDLVKDQVLDRFAQEELNSQQCRIYTTLDMELQKIAVDAVEAGMKRVDALLARRYERWRKQGEDVAPIQAAFVALDPGSGAVRALVGGRDYGRSQLNRIFAMRQPGSVFKPVVYAAAFHNAIDGSDPLITPATLVEDEPTTFMFEGREYTPNNYGREFHGTVTVRDALTSSMNVATVKVAEMIGYGRVVQIARTMGIDGRLEATPSVALGAYDMTPLDVAAAYAVFANLGTRVDPLFVQTISTSRGITLDHAIPRRRPVLDPRVTYLVTDIMKDVIDRGTAASVRASGLTVPAAGKTGTSRDGWFAGFTSNLLAVVWVGFDDNRELNLSGSAAAAPIWAEFMKKASALPAYRDAEEFAPPAGISKVIIDPESGMLGGTYCPSPRNEVFIEGTEPREICNRHGGGILTYLAPSRWFSAVFGGSQSGSASGAGEGRAATAPGTAGTVSGPDGLETNAAGGERRKKKGFMRGLWDFLRGKKSGDEARRDQPKH